MQLARSAGMARKRAARRRSKGKSFVVAVLPTGVEMSGKRRRALDPTLRFEARRKPALRATGTPVRNQRPSSGRPKDA